MSVLLSLSDHAFNPEVARWLEDHPDRAALFAEEELDELYSLQGTGGPLTAAGVEHFVRAIEERRELTRKVQVLCSTHRGSMLRDFVEMLWRDVQLHLVEEPAAEDAPELLQAMGKALDAFKEKLTLLALPKRTRIVSAFDGRAEIVLLVAPAEPDPQVLEQPTPARPPAPPLPPLTTPQPEGVPLNKIERAMQIYLRDPGQTRRQVAAQVPCDPSLLYRSKKFQRLYQAHARAVRRGSKHDGRIEAADDER